MRDNADHDAGDDERNRHERNEHIGDDVDDRGNGRGQKRHIVRIGDALVFRRAVIVARDAGGNVVLVLEGVGVKADGVRRVAAHLAERLHIFVVAAAGDVLVVDGEQDALVRRSLEPRVERGSHRRLVHGLTFRRFRALRQLPGAGAVRHHGIERGLGRNTEPGEIRFGILYFFFVTAGLEGQTGEHVHLRRLFLRRHDGALVRVGDQIIGQTRRIGDRGAQGRVLGVLFGPDDTDDPELQRVFEQLRLGNGAARRACKRAVLIFEIFVARGDEQEFVSGRLRVVPAQRVAVSALLQLLFHAGKILPAEKPQLVQHRRGDRVVFIQHQHDLVVCLRPAPVEHVVAVRDDAADASAVRSGHKLREVLCAGGLRRAGEHGVHRALALLHHAAEARAGGLVLRLVGVSIGRNQRAVFII